MSTCEPRRTQSWAINGLALAAFALAGLPAAAQSPPITDETVDQAVTRAMEWLKTQRNSAGHWEKSEQPTDDRDWAGDSALALLALLYAGENPRQDDMQQSLAWLSSQSIKGTYVYGTRAHVLALVPGSRYRRRLDDDLTWLMEAAYPRGSRNPGAYDYESRKGAQRGHWYDNSNSQFAVLGVWMASEAGANVPGAEQYWQLIQDHWLREQRDDGGWGYKDDQTSSGSMSAAGLATLFVVLDRLHARSGHRQADNLLRAINSAMTWLGREFTPDNPHGSRQWKYYYLYGVERAGRASGRKYFRGRDWFRVGAADLLAGQQTDGSWRGGMTSLRDTTFAMMFLCHGRAPLLFNKLEHGVDWDYKLRDLAGLTRYAEHTFERLLNWQIVDLKGSIDDLMEAPVLYMTGQNAWTFSEAEVQKLREYCLRGGLLLSVADRQDAGYVAWFESLARKLFPNYPLRPVVEGHPLLSGDVQFAIDDPPPLLEAHNGVRPLILLCKTDIANSWNRYQTRSQQKDFNLGCNIYLYATDKTTLRSRLQRASIAPRQVNIVRTIRLARIRYAGEWNVEPYGWTRLGHYLNNEAASRLLVSSGVTLDSDELEDFRIAHISGTRDFVLSDAELSGLRSFLTGGGTLLADAAGGSRAFTQALERHLNAALRIRPKFLPPDAMVLTGDNIPDAVSLSSVSYRRTARSAGRGRKFPRLKAYDLGRRYAVLYSPLDFSSGILGGYPYNCRGYDNAGSLRIARNLLLYAQLNTAQKSKLHRLMRKK